MANKKTSQTFNTSTSLVWVVVQRVRLEVAQLLMNLRWIPVLTGSTSISIWWVVAVNLPLSKWERRQWLQVLSKSRLFLSISIQLPPPSRCWCRDLRRTNPHHPRPRHRCRRVNRQVATTPQLPIILSPSRCSIKIRAKTRGRPVGLTLLQKTVLTPLPTEIKTKCLISHRSTTWPPGSWKWFKTKKKGPGQAQSLGKMLSTTATWMGHLQTCLVTEP